MQDVFIVEGVSEIDGVRHATGKAVPKRTLDAEVDREFLEWGAVFRIDPRLAHPDDVLFILDARAMAVERAVLSAYANAPAEKRTVRMEGSSNPDYSGVIYL